MNIGVQCESLGQRCGIWTYSSRVIRYLNGIKGVHAKGFVNKYKNGKLDVVSIQYEPGMLPPMKLSRILDRYDTEPLFITAHHTLGLDQFINNIDGLILHDENQLKLIQQKPLSYTVIPHPALVFPKKDKIELRKKYGLPEDKKIIGTMGFICGTGKILPQTVKEILNRINDDEFLYLITPFWKGGDMGRLEQIMSEVKKSNKVDNFKIETNFMVDEGILNEKMQCCDLMYAWNNITNAQPGSQSGSAADMYGSYVKLIVKDCPHYSFIGKQDKVLVGRSEPNEFADDVIEALRESDLNDIQDPTWLSWEEKIKDYLRYFIEESGIDDKEIEF